MNKKHSMDDLLGEEWRDVAGFDGRYQVSNKGRVKSFMRSRPAIMRPSSNAQGYLLLSLQLHRKRKAFLVHRLVMMSFRPMENYDGLEVNHIDFNVKNACVENLEWITHLENVRHFHASGRKPDLSKNSGTQNHLSKLTEAEVLEMRRIHSEGKHTMAAMARMFNVSGGTAGQVLKGLTWKHLLPKNAAAPQGASHD